MTRRLLVLTAGTAVVGLAAFYWFSSSGLAPMMRVDGPRVQYAEGTVVTDAGVATVGGERLPDSAGRLEAAIVAYRGLSVGVEYNDRTAILVSPVEDEWERLASAIRGVEESPREHLRLEVQTADAATFPNPSLLRSLDLAVSDVDRQYKDLAAILPGDRPGALGHLVSALKRVVNLGIQTADVAIDLTQRTAAIELSKASRAQYTGGGTLQNYEGASERPARFYRNIVAQLDATVGVRVGTTLNGTGFLVSNDWVLTAGHVVAKVADATTVKALFGYEEGDTGSPVAGTSCDVSRIVTAEPAEGMDLAALQLSCPGGKLPPGAKPLRLSGRTANVDEPVYVVGHPRKATKHVADNAFVRYPHRLSVTGLEIVRDRVNDATERDALNAGYATCEPGWWCYRSSPARWDAGSGQQLIWPTVGFAANTYKGNSGSPLFYADDHSVAGLLFGGRRDYDHAGSFSFFRHEGAIPSAVLMPWLNARGILKGP